MQLCRKLFMACKSTASADDRSSASNGMERGGFVDKSQFITAGILGEGGFGKVLTGMMLKNGCWYAIKEIKKLELVKHKLGLTMIFNELEAMKRVNHPAAINLHFAFHDKKRCFFVLDLKTGGDLRYYLRKRYVFEEIDVAFYIAAISSALDHIHSKNVIHRDVKPENIILDERGYPYLTDFGVAHVQDESSLETVLSCTLASGTKQYLAPEVFTKSHIHGPEADFWSLGVVAYELLFGKRPFDKHCPIAFISYLEKALSLKRRQEKEMKMRQITSLFSSTHPEDLSSSRELTRSSLTRDQSSPSNSVEISTSFVASTNRRAQTASAGGIKGNRSTGDLKSQGLVSVAKSSHTGCHSGAPSPARTMNSTEMGSISQDTHRDLQFCSSVGVTNASSYFSSDFSGFTTPKKPWNTDNAYQGTSPSVTKYAIGFDARNGSLSSSQPPSPQITTAGAVGKGGSCILPELKQSNRSQSPPKSLFNNNISPNSSLKRNNAVGRTGQRLPPSIGIANNGPNIGLEIEDYGEVLFAGDAFEIGGIGSKHVEQPVIYEEDETMDEDNQNHHVNERFVRAIPGDHWLVEDGILHPSLYVDVPESNSWLGTLSLDCQRVLAGFFEVRPNHRLGARNMPALKRCRWFDKFKLHDWEELLTTRRFEPRFQPGKRFIKECLDRMDDVGEARILGEDETNSHNGGSGNNLADLVPQHLTVEEDEAFQHFYHIASQHEDLFISSFTSAAGSSTLSHQSLSSSYTSTSTSASMSASRKMSRPSLATPHMNVSGMISAAEK